MSKVWMPFVIAIFMVAIIVLPASADGEDIYSFSITFTEPEDPYYTRNPDVFKDPIQVNIKFESGDQYTEVLIPRIEEGCSDYSGKLNLKPRVGTNASSLKFFSLYIHDTYSAKMKVYLLLNEKIVSTKEVDRPIGYGGSCVEKEDWIELDLDATLLYATGASLQEPEINVFLNGNMLAWEYFRSCEEPFYFDRFNRIGDFGLQYVPIPGGKSKIVLSFYDKPVAVTDIEVVEVQVDFKYNEEEDRWREGPQEIVDHGYLECPIIE